MVADRYRLEALIGRGAMGSVWRAHDVLLNRDVAVKEIIWPPGMTPAERETARRRAVQEAQLAGRVRHPNVVSVYDITESEDRPCIVMELVPFPSLRDAVAEDGPMTPVQAARIGLDVLAALRAVHEVGVVHRDVKPANILLGPEDRVVLADFGIARAADSPALTRSGVLVGSPSYLAPECARGGRAGPAADLWALGASLYVAVEGKPPFERDGALASLTAVVADEPDPPTRAGPLWPVIDGLLRKDPATRFGVTEAEPMLRQIAARPHAPEPAEPASAQQASNQQASNQQASNQQASNQQASPAATAAEELPHEVMAPPSPAREEPPAAGTTAAGAPVADPPGPVRPRDSRRVRAALVVLAAVAVLAAAGITLALAAGRPAATPPAAAAGTSSAAPSPAPKTSSRPAPSASPAPWSPSPSALPAGYYRFTNSTGFSIGVPQGWQISHVGHYVYIRDPADSGIFLLIDQSDQPKPSALSDWEQQAASRQSSYPGYHLIRLQAIPYQQALMAADWQFTYDRDGTEVEVLNRNILANAHHAYALYWSTPTSDWNTYYHFFAAFAGTFLPAA
jgi:serine/threonine protein kinase